MKIEFNVKKDLSNINSEQGEKEFINEIIESIWDKFSKEYPYIEKEALKNELWSFVVKQSPEYLKENSFDPYAIINDTYLGGV